MSRRVRRARRWRCACVPLVVGLLFASALPAAADTVSYRPPVDAPVADPFRAPAHRYAAGNRGIEYATSSDMPVRAAADGEVIFAGPVAGTLHVTVLHADGLRTSYSFLDRVEVSRGMRVAQLVFAAVTQVRVEERSLAGGTARGGGGFGSTGTA